MKKSAILMAIFICAGTALSAQVKISAGVGGIADYSLNNGIKFKSPAEKRHHELRNLSFGGLFFFDATYVEINADYAFGKLTYVQDYATTALKYGGHVNKNDYGSVLQLGFGVLGKIPMEFESFTLFPLFGINYNMVLVSRDKDDIKREDAMRNLSQFGFQAGIGLDYNINQRLFVRTEGLFQLRLGKKRLDEYFDWKSLGNASTKYNTPGMGPVIKAGVGIRFN